MLILRSLLLCVAFAAAFPCLSTAQPSARHGLGQTPIVLSVTLPTGKPPLTARTLLLQTGAGMLGGPIAAAAVGMPLTIAAWLTPTNEALLLGVIGGAYFVGTVAGIHHVGRERGMSANPWATAAGIVGGLLVAGAAMQPFIDEEGAVAGPVPLLVFVVPSMGGTAGYALTRRARP
jgi:hypothetical protein